MRLRPNIKVTMDGKSKARGNEAMAQRPKIGLALGSGGARGFAHIGVLQTLLHHGIPIDVIAGSSMGALLGAVYATGAPLTMMERLACHMPTTSWIDFTVPHRGFVAGERIHQLIKMLTKDYTFAQTTLPLAIVATDVERGERVVFTEGKLHDAVRASISIPGIFVPYEYQGRLLVDGGVIDRVPIMAARELGSDIVIAVDVGYFEKLPPGKNIIHIIIQATDIMQREMFTHSILHADFVVRPELDLMSATSFAGTGVEKAIEAGRSKMEALMPSLLEFLQKKGVSIGGSDAFTP